MKITKEDLPEEIKNDLLYRSKGGYHVFDYQSEKERIRKEVLKALKKYKEIRKKCIEIEEEKNRYKVLCDKLGL